MSFIRYKNSSTNHARNVKPNLLFDKMPKANKEYRQQFIFQKRK